MNYSQRKYIERLMAGAPGPDCDPLGIWPQRFAGIDVIASPDVPRYTLPERLRLPCGVDIEWPPGYRDGFNRWSRSFLGTTNMVNPGTVYMLAGTRAVMHPSDVVKLSSIT